MSTCFFLSFWNSKGSFICHQGHPMSGDSTSKSYLSRVLAERCLFSCLKMDVLVLSNVYVCSSF